MSNFPEDKNVNTTNSRSLNQNEPEFESKVNTTNSTDKKVSRSLNQNREHSVGWVWVRGFSGEFEEGKR